jgi:hypothetical protein
MNFIMFTGLVLTARRPAAPTFNLFGGAKDASTEKKDASAGEDILRPLKKKKLISRFRSADVLRPFRCRQRYLCREERYASRYG